MPNLFKSKTWIELKSWAAKSEQDRYTLLEEVKRGNFTQWDFSPKTTKGDSLHRQFYLDTAAARLRVAWLTKRESDTRYIRIQQKVADFEWRWQAFKEKDRRTKPPKISAISPLLGSASDNKSVRSLIAKPPLGSSVSNLADYINTNFGSGQTNKMTLSTPANLLTHLASLGFEEVVGEVIDDIDID